MTPYDLVLTPPALRALQGELPEPVAAAIVEFVTGALIENSKRVGKMLRDDLGRIRSARRGTYRILCRINEESHEVVVLRIEHRRDGYRRC